MVRLENILKALAGFVFLGCISLGILEESYAKIKTVKSVTSEIKTLGHPGPFTSWDMYYQHQLTFSDGTTGVVKTDDFSYPVVRKLTGYKEKHPKPGDQYKVGQLFGSVMEKVDPS